MLLGHLRHGDHAADHDRPRRSYGRIERRAGGRSFGRVRVLHRVRILPRVRSHDRVRSRMRRRRCVPAASTPLALQRVHIHLVPARTGRSLVWLAVTWPVQHRARRSAVSLRDLPGRLAVAVELRFVGRRSRVRVVRRVVRRLHARLSRAHLLCSVRNGWSGHRRCRSFVLLQLTRRVRRVAVALRRVRHGCRSNRRIVFAVSLAVPLAVAVTGERRSGRQSSDAEYEHAGAHEPQFHVSPSFPSLVLLPALTLGMSRGLSSHLQTRRAARGRLLQGASYLDLGPELGAEGAFERRNDATSELCSVLVGQCALSRLERDREGDRLLSEARSGRPR